MANVLTYEKKTWDVALYSPKQTETCIFEVTNDIESLCTTLNNLYNAISNLSSTLSNSGFPSTGNALKQDVANMHNDLANTVTSLIEDIENIYKFIAAKDINLSENIDFTRGALNKCCGQLDNIKRLEVTK